MKPSSSTWGRPHSTKVRALDGSKDVRGARREPKGRVVLIVLELVVPDYVALIEPVKCVPELYQK